MRILILIVLVLCGGCAKPMVDSTSGLWTIPTTSDEFITPECPTDTIVSTVPTLALYGDINESIKLLAQSGKVCEVYGHWWEYQIIIQRLQENIAINNDGNIISIDNDGERHCKFCGKIQVWKEEWADGQ